MLQGKERVIEIPGFTLAAKEWGNSNGMPVLAVHGWLDNAESFSCLAPLLPHLHIIAVDSPGCGHSTHRAPGAISYMVDEVFYMFAVASALGWQTFSVMGHSRGGGIAQLMGASAPERIRDIILLDIVGLYSGTPEESLEHLRKSVHTYFNLDIKRPTIYPNLETAAEARLNDSSLSYENALKLTIRGTKQIPEGVIWTFDRREMFFFSPVRYTEDMIHGLLGGIEAPTCIIIAEDGLYKDNQKEITKAQYIKNKVLHRIPGGHFVHMNNPELVAGIILEFFKSKS